MSDALTVENNGAIISKTNFWETSYAQRGLLYISVNAGSFRLLVPTSQRDCISDMLPKAKHVVVSMLPLNQWKDGAYCIEWMVEDGSDSPWSCTLSPQQIDRAPGIEDVGKQWEASVWDSKNGAPHRRMHRPAYFQIVPKLPWLRRV